MADFNTLEPKKAQTDPHNIGAITDFPRHVHKWAGPGQMNDYHVVRTAEALAEALANGWSLTPVTTAPEVNEAPDADAPVRRKPGRPAAA